MLLGYKIVQLKKIKCLTFLFKKISLRTLTFITEFSVTCICGLLIISLAPDVIAAALITISIFSNKLFSCCELVDHI